MLLYFNLASLRRTLVLMEKRQQGKETIGKGIILLSTDKIVQECPEAVRQPNSGSVTTQQAMPFILLPGSKF